MKVLWVTNVAPTSYGSEHGRAGSPMAGWISSIGLLLKQKSDWQPLVAFPSASVREGIDSSNLRDLGYLEFSSQETESESFLRSWRELIQHLDLDAVHIFGTELPHSLVVARAAKMEGIPIIITLQGLVSIIARHVDAGLEDVGKRHMTLRSLLRGDSIQGLRTTYTTRGQSEIQTLGMADYVIGRTEWDLACATQLAPQAKYFHLNETLRESFYRGSWDPDECKPFSVVMSQANNPLKGLHVALEAITILKGQYPEISLYVAGRPPYYSSRIKQRVLGTQYGSLLRARIKKDGLDSVVNLVGLKSEAEMKELYLSANVFLSASSIENESNSLSEAKALGVPCVASYAGGVTSRIEHGVTGYFYQHSAPYMAAYFISKVFNDSHEARMMGQRAQLDARKTLDPATNLKNLLEIYKTLTYKS